MGEFQGVAEADCESIREPWKLLTGQREGSLEDALTCFPFKIFAGDSWSLINFDPACILNE